VGISDTAYKNSIGNSVHKYDILSKQLDLNFTPIQMPVNHNVYGIAFDGVNHILYIADALNFTSNGQVWTFSTAGTHLKTYSIGGIAPVRFAFKYNGN
jgi:hypothetical protein